MKSIIVVCHDNVAPLTGAGGVRALKIAQGFSKKGYDTIVIAPSNEKNIQNLDIYNIYSVHNKKNVLINLLKFNFSLFFQLRKHIRKTNFIVVHNAISLPAVIILAGIFRKKVFVEITDIHSEYVKMRPKTFYFNFMPNIASFFEYKLISLAEKIFAVTNEMKSHLQSHGIDGNKIYVIYDGVNEKQFHTQKNPGSRNKVVHLGLVNAHNGVEYLIQSFVFVLEKLDSAMLHIIGDGLEIKNCVALAKRLKIEKNIIFQKFKKHALMGDILKDFSVGVIPRPDTTGNNLVMTLKLLEYWASGTAVIASRLKGIEEITRDNYNILFAAAGNPRDLADKILTLLQDQDKVINLSLGGLASVKSFSWENTVDKTINFCIDEN